MSGGERAGGGPAARLLQRGRRHLPAALAAAGLLLASAAWLGVPPGGDAEVVTAALARGNRLARRGDLEPAVEAYRTGWPAGGGAGAALAYNLGTAYHRLGRLPEALLWYRRAAALAPSDPWVADNLELARAELAAVRDPPPGLSGRLAAYPAAVPAAAVLLAWSALVLWLARPRLLRAAPPGGEPLARHAWTAAALLALAAWAAGAALAAWGPRPAVLLDPCGAGGELAAGSEVWVVPAGDGGWAVAGRRTDAVCPASSLGLVSANL
jgi:tetratricopeptide (TPR) repeat protein